MSLPSVRETVVDSVNESKKKEKSEVDYSGGHKNSRCGICEYFITPDKCEKVKGDILPSKWCILFKKKQ